MSKKKAPCQHCGRMLFPKTLTKTHEPACKIKMEKLRRKSEEKFAGRPMNYSINEWANREMGIDESLLDEDWGNKWSTLTQGNLQNPFKAGELRKRFILTGIGACRLRMNTSRRSKPWTHICKPVYSRSYELKFRRRIYLQKGAKHDPLISSSPNRFRWRSRVLRTASDIEEVLQKAG